MNLRLEVLSVETFGDRLSVVLQGVRRASGPTLKQTLQIMDTMQNRRAYYVGRVVEMDLHPRE